MTIGEVSDQYDVSKDTLRYYEKIGLLKDIERKGGIRCYSEMDCLRVEFIVCMRSAGLKIEFLREYMRLLREGDSTAVARKELLLKQKRILEEKMANLQKTMGLLNYKLDYYDDLIRKLEKEFSGPIN